MKTPKKRDYPGYYLFYIKKKRIDSILNKIPICFAFIFFLVGILFIFSEGFVPQKEENIRSNISDYPNCAGLPFQDTAICLNNYVRKIFIYNVTDDNVVLSLEELKARGGDCKIWTQFYEEYMRLYGFNQTQQVNMFVKEEKKDGKTLQYYHVFLTVSDTSGYCNFDMQDLECYKFVNPKEENNGM